MIFYSKGEQRRPVIDVGDYIISLLETRLPTYARNIRQESIFTEVLHAQSFYFFMIFFNCSINFSTTIDYIMITQRNRLNARFIMFLAHVIATCSIIVAVTRVTFVGSPTSCINLKRPKTLAKCLAWLAIR